MLRRFDRAYDFLREKVGIVFLSLRSSKYKNKNPILVLFALTSLSCIGCGSIPTKQLDAFANATSELSLSLKSTDTRIETLAAHHAVDVADPNKPITATTLELVNATGGKSYDITDDLRYREIVLQTVSDYASLLKTFGEDDSASEIDKASMNLAGSLQALGNTANPAAKNIQTYSGISATVVDLAGRALTQYMRRRALIQAMSNAQGDLTQISSAFMADIEDIKVYIADMCAGFIARANALRPRVRACRSGGKAEEDIECYRGRRDDEISRMKADTDTQALLLEVAAVNSAVAAISDGVAKVPQVHKEILNALEQSPSKAESIDELVGAAKQANSFYQGLK